MSFFFLICISKKVIGGYFGELKEKKKKEQAPKINEDRCRPLPAHTVFMYGWGEELVEECKSEIRREKTEN